MIIIVYFCVREIENFIERAVVMCSFETELLDIKHFAIQEQPTASSANPILEQNMTLRETEKFLILRNLEEQNGNRTVTANMLGISVRTLRNKLNEYRQEGIDI